MSIVSVPFCYRCGVPHVPDDVAERVRVGESISIDIVYTGSGVAANVTAHGTGALNIDGCRIAGVVPSVPQPDFRSVNGRATHLDANRRNGVMSEASGRWPANVILDDEAAALLDAQSGISKSTGGRGSASYGALGNRVYGQAANDRPTANLGGIGDTGGASRFFYCAKASRAERNAGLDGMPERKSSDDGYGSIQQPILDRVAPRENWQPHKTANVHPCVKPVSLMRWLCRLITPPGGTILDPFLGSGTTGIAAALEGFDFIGIEQDAEYLAIAERRIAHVEKHGENWLKGAKATYGGPRRYGNGKGMADTVRRCPEHGESFPSGSNVYRCGCPAVRVPPMDVTKEKTDPAIDYGPLFAQAAD